MYLADPTSPIPSHCAVTILFKSVPVHELLWRAQSSRANKVVPPASSALELVEVRTLVRNRESPVS